jgi:pSer/pThr/pTyr-binding forkhead associated (FHA) protein
MPDSAPTDQPAPATRSPGRMVVRETGAEQALLPGQSEWIIGRSDPVRGIYPDVDLTPHGGDTHGVSRRHARLVMHDGQIHLEDLNSTNYTFINRQRLQPGQLHPLKDGDEVRLGLLALEYRQA